MANVLDQGAFNGNNFIAYIHRYISRSFNILGDQTNAEQGTFQIPAPASDEELKCFYSCVGRIMSV